ncbi:unnamed protein product [Rhizophagus irregularis]|nr:unnamed protein product [Rhizophagus irregularis]
MFSQNIPLTENNILEYLKTNFTNWTSGNEKINSFIQERQLKIKVSDYNDIVLEWIPYNQFNEIKETGKNGSTTVYSAIWKDGPLYKLLDDDDYIRDSNKKAKKYPIKHSEFQVFQVLYGISQSPETGDFIFVQRHTINLTNWISGNEKIDDFIQERQLKRNGYDDTVLEWIPYDQFNEIKETGKNDLITVYSAIWKDGPLFYNKHYKNYIRDSNKKAKKYPISHNAFQVLYGISQNPDTGNYILVLIWTSGNEKIDEFIQERQSEINDYAYDNDNIVLEWIAYNQFNEIKETGKNSLVTVYSAIWKDGPLYKDDWWNDYTRESNKKVALKYLYNSQESIDSLINEAKKYPIKHKAFQILYGISQNPDTGDFIFVQSYTINLTNWISGNENIDYFIQEKQLKINDHDDTVLEWIPYNQFNEIKETGKNDLITVYSAIWKDGPLYKKHLLDDYYTRDPNKVVALKCLHSSQESIDSLINKAKKYPTKHKAFQVLYGISQNPDTGDYILVLIWTSGNEIIDDFIQERQLKINDYNDVVFEWIPYSQFNNIKEIGKGGFSTVYSAEWKNGPLEYNMDEEIYNRNPNRVIALKCLHNSQSITDKFLNEVKEYSMNKSSNILNIYGISQNPDIKEYIMVLQYAKEGNFNHWINKNYEYFNWKDKISALLKITNGLKEIHQRNLVHRDFHTGNILFLYFINNFSNCLLISDMGLCGEVDNIDETKIYGVMPYVAPEVLRGKPYTQAADIYSLGMIMYYIATERQPFDDCAHDSTLALNICNGIWPKINEQEAPKCYINLMKKCWDQNPDKRPNAKQLLKSLLSISTDDLYKVEIEEAENYRILHLPSSKDDRQVNIHSQAIYTSRLLNPFTKDLNSECLDCAI